MRYSSAFDLSALSRRSGRAGTLSATDAAAHLSFDGPIHPRAEAIFWLSAAAEIEHALMVQYLFAAYSIDVEGAGPAKAAAKAAAQRLVQIAREEMGHLVTVQNILTVLGGTLHFQRAHSPLTSDIHPFRFKLEPLSLASAAKYVVAESPDVPPEEIDMLSDERKALLRDVVQGLARESNDGHEVLHVGPIFGRLIDLVGTELEASDIRLDRAPYQADWDDWGYDGSAPAVGPAQGQRVLVRKIDAADAEAARQQIVEALRAIGDQGEFVDTADDLDESHFERFLQLFEELKEIQDSTGRLPVWPVAIFPNTSVGAAGPVSPAAVTMMNRHMNEGRITNTRSRAWAHLFNLRYRLLIDVIAHSLLIPGPLYWTEPEQRGRRTPKGQLHAFSFAEMVRIQQLSAKLVSLPLDDGDSDLHAGPPFELDHTVSLPAHEVDRWRQHADRFGAGAEWAASMRQAHDMDSDDPFLGYLVEADAAAQRLCLAFEARASQASPGDSGPYSEPPPPPTAETRFHEVVQALEDGVRGFDLTRDPAGQFHGNFWAEKTHEALLAYRSPSDSKLIEPGDPGASLMFQRISSDAGPGRWMPRSRPKLPDARLRHIEGWIADGAPDAEPNGAIGLTRPPAPKPEPRRTPAPQPAEPTPMPGAPVFETDIRPIFTDFHREMMRFRLDLHSYDDVKGDHRAIRNAIRGGTMPCPAGGGPLPEDQIALFEAWIDGGFNTDGSSVGEPTEPPVPEQPADPGTGFEDGPYKDHRWRRTNAPLAPGVGPPRYDDIWHVDRNVGWAVNSNGEILATRDGWISFRKQFQTPDRMRLRCIGFANDRVGWVGNVDADPDQRLLKTTDGGETWSFVENLPGPNPRQVCGLWVVDENIVYLAGSNENEGNDPGPATVLKTTDGGSSWLEIDLHAAANARTLIDVFFEDAERGWVVGGVDTVGHPNRTGSRGDLVPGIFRTTDGGQTWSNVVQGDKKSASGRRFVGRTGVFPQGEWGWKIQRVDSDTLVVAIQNYRDGAMLRSEDGGETWERLRINDSQRNSNLEGIGFVDRSNGWVGGYGDITYQAGYSSMTRDGGQNWIVSNSIGNRINRFRFAGPFPHTVYASGDTIYKFSDEPFEGDELERRDEMAAVHHPMQGWDQLEMEIEVPEGTSRMTIRIWERDGRFVRLLEDEPKPAPGRRTVQWNFRNDSGELEDVGTYIIRITLDETSQSHLIYRRPVP